MIGETLIHRAKAYEAGPRSTGLAPKLWEGLQEATYVVKAYAGTEMKSTDSKGDFFDGLHLFCLWEAHYWLLA